MSYKYSTYSSLANWQGTAVSQPSSGTMASGWPPASNWQTVDQWNGIQQPLAPPPLQHPAPRSSYLPSPIPRARNPAPPYQPAPVVPLRDKEAGSWGGKRRRSEAPVESGPSLVSGPVFATEPPMMMKKVRGVPRKPCCAEMPKTQWKRHWDHHCPNNPNKKTKTCQYCGKVMNGRGDNFERHSEDKCPERRLFF